MTVKVEGTPSSPTDVDPSRAGPEPAPPAALKVDDVSFAYGDHLILRSIDLSIAEGEFVSIIGPSGCGKSTLLMMMAGLLKPGRGRLLVQGHEVTGPSSDRAVVFQHFALMPWKTVASNVEVGLKYRRKDLSRSDRRDLAEQYLEKVGLRGQADKYPYQLSGGMQQRVGLARAFVCDPAVLLMDEPFGALDAQNAELMREELRALVARERRTIVFVTHNLDEALYLSDRVILMGARPGRIEEDVRIDLSHPRGLDVSDPEEGRVYGEYRSRLWEHLRREVIAERDEELA